jgi:hypothetical protein
MNLRLPEVKETREIVFWLGNMLESSCDEEDACSETGRLDKFGKLRRG